jgi:hypothetical protein
VEELRRIIGEEDETMTPQIPTFEQYCQSLDAKALSESNSSPLEMYLHTVQLESTKYFTECAKKVWQEISKDFTSIVTREFRVDQFTKKNIPALFQQFEAIKDDLDSITAKEIEAKLNQVFELSGLEKLEI